MRPEAASPERSHRRPPTARRFVFPNRSLTSTARFTRRSFGPPGFGGPLGTAAQALAKVLDPHFVREEQIALPPLGLLAPLVRGDDAKPMRSILPLTDSLRLELPRMLEEYKATGAATAPGEGSRRGAQCAGGPFG